MDEKMSGTVFADNMNVWNKGLKRPFIRLYWHELGYGIYNTPDANSTCCRIGEVVKSESREISCKRLPTPGTPLCCYLRSRIKKSMFLQLASKQTFVCCIKCSYRVQIMLYELPKPAPTNKACVKSKPKTKDYACHICGRQFARKASMTSHFPCRNTFGSA